MVSFRQALPQLRGDLFLTDGGIETTLIFLEGIELPDFAAFQILDRAEGIAVLRKYFHTYAALAQRYGTGLILESATWRASPDWGDRLGFSARQLDKVNLGAIELLQETREEFKDSVEALVISGCLGPRGDGYSPGRTMSEMEAEAYHARTIEVFQDSAADMISGLTMNYVEEAIGIARAAERAGMPVAISFTVETDGRLPTGQTLRSAVEQVDAATTGYPSYYMINCAHATHFAEHLVEGESWTERIRGLRANASKKSHAELNDSLELDFGDPVEFGQQYAELKKRLPALNVLGGCCGTDHRHVEQIASACSPLFGAAG